MTTEKSHLVLNSRPQRHQDYITTLNFREQFVTSLTQFCHLALNEGQKLTPFRSPSLPYFSRLSVEQQNKILDNFNEYFQICLGTVGIHQTLKDHLAHFKLTLQKFNFWVDSSIWSELKDNNVIEIYTSDSTQVFRTFNFYQLVRFTLEELFCRPWYELYQRDSFTNRANLNAVQKVLSGHSTQPIFPHIPIHKVKTNPPFFLCVTNIEHRFMAPLYLLEAGQKKPDKYQEPSGFMNVFNVLEHSEKSSNEGPSEHS